MHALRFAFDYSEEPLKPQPPCGRRREVARLLILPEAVHKSKIAASEEPSSSTEQVSGFRGRPEGGSGFSGFQRLH